MDLRGFISSNLKKGERFTGQIRGDINKFIANHIDTCNDLKAKAEKRLKYFHNQFDKDAKRFHCKAVQVSAVTFSETCDLIPKKYNLSIRQHRIRK